MDEDDEDSPVFTTPSGQSLDGSLSSLLDRAADAVDSSSIIAVGMVFIDATCDAWHSRIIVHPLAHELLAKRFRAAADSIEQSLKAAEPPQNNSSAALH